MSKRKMNSAEAFFYLHSGYVVGKRREGAEELAHAEAVAGREGWKCGWEHDDLPWDGDCEAPSEILCAVLYDAAGNILASLGGIGDPSDDYRRVVAAELAIEALDRAAALTKRARKAVRK